MSETMDELIKEYQVLIKNVRPRALGGKINDSVMAMMTQLEQEIRDNANNPILNAMKRGYSNAD